MGFLDDIKKGIQSAANAVEEAKKREAERANAGTLRPDAVPVVPNQPAAAPATPAHKDVWEIKWGTQYPLKYHDFCYGIDTPLRLNGTVTYRENVPGTADPNTIREDMVRAIIIDSLQGKILPNLESMQVPYDMLPANQNEIRKSLMEALELKGLKPEKLMLASLTTDQATAEKHKELKTQKKAMEAAKLASMPTVQCPSCGAASPADTKFCSSCGAVLRK